MAVTDGFCFIFVFFSFFPFLFRIPPPQTKQEIVVPRKIDIQLRRLILVWGRSGARLEAGYPGSGIVVEKSVYIILRGHLILCTTRIVSSFYRVLLAGKQSSIAKRYAKNMQRSRVQIPHCFEIFQIGLHRTWE